jgi:hypothetical protein
MLFITVPSPNMLFNQPWYWFAQTWNTPGTQYCNIHAHNSLGEVAIVYFDLLVGPAGFGTPTGGGSDGQLYYPPGDPRNPAPTGSSARAGAPMGFYNPATGLTYSDPAGTNVCGGCSSDGTNQTNATTATPSTAPTAGSDGSTTGTGGSDGNGGSSSGGGNGG